MSRVATVELDDHLGEFVANQVAKGRFASSAEVLRAGLMLLEHEEVRVAALRAALIEGEDSGDAPPFDLRALLREVREAIPQG